MSSEYPKFDKNYYLFITTFLEFIKNILDENGISVDPEEIVLIPEHLVLPKDIYINIIAREGRRKKRYTIYVDRNGFVGVYS